MRIRSLFATLVSLAAVTAGYAAAQTNPLEVHTDKGELRGKLSDDGATRIFLGVPYAAPPVGPLRWRPPQEASAWQGIRSAESYGSHCIQANQFADMRFHDPGASEDCLTLNVWTPETAAPGAKLPVMVWIYGGGFYAGSTSEGRQDGENFAREGVILVSMNYRMNIFGFFAHPALAAESPAHAAGNYGLMDEAAAVQWVHRNIAAFGGDPANITLFGESAGSFAVSAQMASPMAKDLLAHAIGESGGAFSRSALSFLPADEAEAQGAAFAANVLGATSLQALRALPAETLQHAVETQKGTPVRFGPDVDGLFLPESVPALYAAGKQAHIPMLAGWNRDEGSFAVKAQTLAEYRAHAHAVWGANADAFLQAYPATTDAEAQRSALDYAGDRFIAASTWSWIQAQVKTGDAPVYRYEFDHPSPESLDHPGVHAYHSSEIEYVFGNLDKRLGAAWTPADYKLSETMQEYWVNFAKTGNPNGAGLPQWPQYDRADDWQVMHLNLSSKAEPDTTKARYEFLETHTPMAGSTTP